MKNEVIAENGQIVSSEELMTKILQFLLTKYPQSLQEYPILYVLTVPLTTKDQVGACKFMEQVAKKVINETYWFQSALLAQKVWCIEYDYF